jgi:hypothetical protein
LKTLVVIDFINPEGHCVQNSNIPAVLIGSKFFLIAGEHKLQISDHEFIRKCLGPGSMKQESN